MGATWSSARGTEIQNPTGASHQRERKTYAWLTGDASGNYNDVSAGKGFLETVVGGEVALDLRGSCDVREVSSNTRGVDDIEEAKLGRGETQ